MACTHYHARSWRQWRHWFSKPPSGNDVPWFPGPDREAKNTLVERIEAWFLTDEAHGLYWCTSTMPAHATIHPDGKRSCHVDEMGWTWQFTDPDTAFAFKMRFM